MFKKYICYKKLEISNSDNIFNEGDICLCEIDQESTKIEVNGNLKTYMYLATYVFYMHFISLKQDRKQKLKNLCLK